MPKYLYQYESIDPQTREPWRCVGGYFEAESDEAAAQMVRDREEAYYSKDPELQRKLNQDVWMMGSPPFTIFRIEPVRVHQDRDPELF